METINGYHEIAAVFIARIFLGCLFFFQGYDAVFRIRIRNVISTFEANFSGRGIPKYLTVAASWFTSCTELICGLLLIAGLFEYMALYLLGLNLIVAAVGFGINTPMWDTRHVLPRLLLLVFLLSTPAAWHVFSLDRFIFQT